jgi:hypothetical protein
MSSARNRMRAVRTDYLDGRATRAAFDLAWEEYLRELGEAPPEDRDTEPSIREAQKCGCEHA